MEVVSEKKDVKELSAKFRAVTYNQNSGSHCACVGG
jgi:hypothetical protein